jgi:beta-glucosidase
LPTDGEVEVTVTVRNTGTRSGSEVVQLYAHDVVAQLARPTKQLIGFVRVALEPGASREVRFRVHADRFAYTNGKYERIVEPGDVQLLLGNSAADLPCRETIRLTGRTRIVGSDRHLVTPVEVVPSER